MIKDFNKTAIITATQDIAYSELLARIDHYASFTPTGSDTKTLIFSENRCGWIYAFFSVWKNGGIPVPVDASNSAHDVAYIINDCSPSCIWVSRDREAVAREAIKETGAQTSVLIIDDYENAPLKTPFAQNTGDVETMSDTTLGWGRKHNETAVIIYTSGTTGSPKGVMLSFANLWANIKSVAFEVPIFNDRRRALILLPLHHILPLMGCMIAPIIMGGGVAISPSMSGPDIMNILCRGRVAIFVGVPRLWQTLYSGIMKQVNAHAITRGLFSLCSTINSTTFSRIIFHSLHKKMGGNLEYCVCGGAALDREIGSGLQTLGLSLLEGYGMSETAPIIAFTRPGDYIPGCAGLPLPSVHCKLISLDGSEETPEEGELCVKGPNVMQGYYNRPEETAAVIDKDGYLHTGDIARFDKDGRVILTGRCKEIIVLSNGKNVQPSEIEYKLEKFEEQVKEAAVAQDGDMLRAIIVPQPLWAGERNDTELEIALKREVLEPYNLNAPGYKKLMSVMVYRGDLPRTKLDKLQRYKLKDILAGRREDHAAEVQTTPEPTSNEYQILKNYIQQEKKIPVHGTDHIETDLAMDSLDKVGLQGFIENTFGIEIDVDNMATFHNIAAMAEHIASNKTRMEVEEIDWNKILHQQNTANQSKEQLARTQLPHTSFLYPVWTKLLKLIVVCHNSLSIKGKHNIPKKGPYILAPNHQSYIDAPIALAGLSYSQVRKTYFYATEEHINTPLRRLLARRNNIIIMERRNLKNSILKMSRVLQQGCNLCIFPEGSRTHTGEVGEFKKTFAILSRELNVPIVPVRITGAFEAMPRTSKFPNTHHVQVEYLQPIMPTEADTYDSLSETTRQNIAAGIDV